MADDAAELKHRAEAERDAAAAGDLGVKRIPQHRKEALDQSGIKGELRRQLHQDDGQLAPELSHLVGELRDKAIDINEPCLMGDCLGYLDREAKLIGNALRPLLPRRRTMRSMEGGVYLHRVEHARVALQGGAVRREGSPILTSYTPPGSPDPLGHERPTQPKAYGCAKMTGSRSLRVVSLDKPIGGSDRVCRLLNVVVHLSC